MSSVQESVFIAAAAIPQVFSHKVLVVEDELRMRQALVHQVRDLGCETLEAATAHEAIRIAAEARPDVILVDGLLPQMHGFELARFIRGFDPTYNPRIVIVTGIYKQTRYRNEAKLKYGIDDYLIKPVENAALRQVLA